MISGTIAPSVFGLPHLSRAQALAIKIRHRIVSLPISPTLKANQTVAEQRRRGKAVLHMGFGQSPFPVHPKLADALAGASDLSQYEDVAGLGELRSAALSYFAAKLSVDPDDYDVLVAPGSKLILYALQLAIEGDLVLPVPSWVSYEPQAAMLGDRVIRIPADLSEAGYRIEPGRLRAAIRKAKRDGLHPTKLILNSPNNPTGLTVPVEDHHALAEVCRDEDIFVISDEIYGLVTFNGVSPSFAGAYPSATAITTGLSKHLSLGGWRVGFGLVPKAARGLFEAVRQIASETWSSVASPVQYAAIVAVSGDFEIEQYLESCTRIHCTVARYAANQLASERVLCLRPQGAFISGPTSIRRGQDSITTASDLRPTWRGRCWRTSTC